MRTSSHRVIAGAALVGSCVFLTGCPQPPPPDSSPQVNVRTIASGLTSPVAMVAANDGTGRLFVVDQTGFISIIDANDQLLPTPFLDVRDRLAALDPGYDERGLLGLALHPDFANNGLFYVYYSPAAARVMRLCEFLVDATNPNRADPLYERFLLDVPQPQDNHNGGQLAFGPDGFLYIASGDGGGANDQGDGHTPNLGNGQDLTTLLGKILRIDVNTISGAPYAVPIDNPFVSGPSGARAEIYAYGLRNPWKFSFDTDDAGATRLYVADVGQGDWEEINIVERGDNLGWYFREGAGCFDPDGVAPAGCQTGIRGEPLIDPVIEYPHVEPDEGGIFGLSVIGGYVYRGGALPELAGRYIFGDFSSGFVTPQGKLFVGTEASDGSWSVEELLVANRASGRIDLYLLSFGMDEAGELYALGRTTVGPSGTTGVVVKLVPAN